MPTLTRANVEREAVGIVGRLMALVGLDGGTADGTNASLNGPLRDALERIGYPIADPVGLTVADADLAILDPRALRRLLEWVELLVLEQVDRDWWRASANRPPGMGLEVATEGDRSSDPLDRIYAKIKSRTARLREVVAEPYQAMNVPIAMGRLIAGSRRDPTRPPSLADLIPPWALAPDGLWLYGVNATSFWGVGTEECP